MAWIESHQSLSGHPKLIDLCHAMGWPKDVAIGKLHMFWWWCLDYAIDGDLTKHNDGRIASAMCVDIDDSNRLVEAMVQACWLERKPYFRVHDWWDYVGTFLQIKWKRYPEEWRRVRDLYLKQPELLQAPPQAPLQALNTNLTNQPNQPTLQEAATLPDGQWLELLRKDKTYEGIDVNREFGKCQAWCLTNRKKCSRRRFINWLNRVEKPINGITPTNGDKAPMSGVDKVLFGDELKRVTQRMAVIKSQYEGHQVWCADDKAEWLRLRDRKRELMDKLGVQV